MSKMIPPFYDGQITSDGEKKLFHSLSKLSDDYVVLHSLGIAEHREKVFGEIDFVVICDKGILCLEVKGGHVYRRDGYWYFTDRYGKETKKTEGPFRQVFSNMLSLRDHIKRHFGPADPLACCQFACGVAFPDMPFTQKGPDIIPEVVFDARSNDDGVEAYIKKVFDYWSGVLEEKLGFKGGKLTSSQITKAEKYLRGDFGFVPSLGYILEKTEEKLIELTKEQMQRLSIAAENPRILMRGGAGTGKTLLSLEHAGRCAGMGKRVLFLCYNNNLSKYLRSSFKHSHPEIQDMVDIFTFHGYISNELKEYGYLQHHTDCGEESYWTKTLPEMFLKLGDEERYQNRYDTLVVDEGQDLLRMEYIMCFDVMINGGLKKGNWHICYDANQNIYNREFEDGLELISEYNPVLLTLDTNCRNTRPIGLYTTLLTGTIPAKYFRVDGENVERIPYTDFNDERRILVKTVQRLIGQGVKPGNICLLSKYSFENSCLQGNNIFKGICRFMNITDLNPRYIVDNCVKFCTVHSFKGLEAPVVILLDVDDFAGDKARLLNYTAMSRAVSMLYIFYSADLKDEMLDMVGKSSNLILQIED